MNKKMNGLALLATGWITGFSITANAEDFSTLTNDQLFDLRGSVAETDRNAFRDEMKSRVSAMSSEERSAFRSLNSANRSSAAGGGQGRGYGGSEGGKGSMTRTRTRQGGGAGYQSRSGSGYGGGRGRH